MPGCRRCASAAGPRPIWQHWREGFSPALRHTIVDIHASLAAFRRSPDGVPAAVARDAGGEEARRELCRGACSGGRRRERRWGSGRRGLGRGAGSSSGGRRRERRRAERFGRRRRRAARPSSAAGFAFGGPTIAPGSLDPSMRSTGLSCTRSPTRTGRCGTRTSERQSGAPRRKCSQGARAGVFVGRALAIGGKGKPQERWTAVYIDVSTKRHMARRVRLLGNRIFAENERACSLNPSSARPWQMLLGVRHSAPPPRQARRTVGESEERCLAPHEREFFARRAADRSGRIEQTPRSRQARHTHVSASAAGATAASGSRKAELRDQAREPLHHS